MREFAPKSALVLGRAVSIQDLEALAAGVTGVRAVAASWRWHAVKQRAVAQIYYLGEPEVAVEVSQRLRSLADPALAVAVQPALPIPVWLTIDVLVAREYRAEDVEVAIRDALLNPDHGLLAPENIGIGKPLFRSRIFETVLSVPGAKGIRGIFIYWFPFFIYALNPGADAYFDLELGQLSLILQEEV
jgi:hypothetical protein